MPKYTSRHGTRFAILNAGPGLKEVVSGAVGGEVLGTIANEPDMWQRPGEPWIVTVRYRRGHVLSRTFRTVEQAKAAVIAWFDKAPWLEPDHD